MRSVYREALAQLDCSRLLTARYESTPLIGTWDVIAVGKAAARMAEATALHLRNRLHRGFILTKTGHLQGFFDSRFEQHEAAHPVPDKRSLSSTSALIRWCSQVSDADNLLVLMSGGTSSLLCLPVDSFELAEFRQIQNTLLKSGLPIERINVLRKHLSQVKGGQMSVHVAGYQDMLQLTLVDVCGPGLSPEEILSLVGSGPFLADPSSKAEAEAVLEQISSKLGRDLYLKARNSLRETPGTSPFKAVILADHLSLRTCARSILGSQAADGPALDLQGDVASLSPRLARAAVKLQAEEKYGVLVTTGEPTVEIPSGANGKGGRCQELALRFAREVAGKRGLRLLAGSSDGTDGPTDKAGAVVDGETWPELCGAVGAEKAEALLDNHDSLTALSSVPGSLIETGPTGQNINDLVLLEIARP